MSSVEKRRSDFSCFKCEKIIPGPYTELSRHFRIQHGFKTADHFQFSFPNEIFFGSQEQHLRNKNGICSSRQVPHTFQYISLRSTLTALFSNEEFFSAFFSEKGSTDGFIRSHRDSSHYSTHEFFKRYPYAVRLQIFYDDVDLVNPLGTKVKKHEIGNFCFVILNLPPLLNSSFKNIHPFAIVKTQHWKKYGFGIVIKEFMKEITILESEGGMLLDIPSRSNFRVHGTIATLCADTKGAHEIGGFMSPSATKLCRLCNIERSAIPNHATTDSIVFRTRQSIDDGVQRVLHCPEEYPNGDSSTDCMHDFAEGIIPFFLKLCLREWVVNKREYGLTADFINKRISFFHYGSYDSENKPSEKFSDAILRAEGNYNIKQRAAQSLCLMRHFPLLFGDRIANNDPHYQFVLLFLQIMDIVFAPAITLAHIYILKDLIFVLFEKFNLLFPNVQPINKMHHLIHYHDIMRLHGPPTRYWCMRFEAFHYVIKRRAQFIGNYVNICISMAVHVQRLHCLNFIEDKLISTKPVFGRMLNPEVEISSPNWVVIAGWKYHHGGILVINKSFETSIMSVVRTVEFDAHYYVFVVENKTLDKTIVLNIVECLRNEPLDLLFIQSYMDCNPEKIKLWTVLEVEENLKKQGFGENITSILKGNEIDGEALLLLNNADVLNMGFKIGPAAKFRNFLESLKIPLNNNPSTHSEHPASTLTVGTNVCSGQESELESPVAHVLHETTSDESVELNVMEVLRKCPAGRLIISEYLGRD
ncbi:Uncharacterized protein APZ42_016191 [Daphnia magna]|uniref:SAM domain-containing protein n=1 Tax=Daphnia magna TaxID=35525 RepID=A0A165AJI2_9CRUS|nr:Uncharacterized protein APZ42_016191 [Daphnia magna]